MSRIKIHIALVICGIFAFPLIYQPVHVVLHHSAKMHCHQHCASATKKENPSGVFFYVSEEEEEHCPICDYHFPIKDLPRISFFSTFTPAFMGSLNPAETNNYYPQVIFNKSPRAPPAYHA